MNIAVIFAGGTGIRMNSKDRPKQFLEIYNKPIIIHTLEKFEENFEIDSVVIACIEEWIPYMESLLNKYSIKKVRSIVPGGETGQMSIYAGLCAAEKLTNGKDAVVLIHDGVRPLITSELISENIRCVKENGSAITAGSVTETIVVVDEKNNVEQIPERVNSRVAKAPQSFWLSDVISGYRKTIDNGITNVIDSCTLMQRLGFKLTMIDGPYENIKITTPSDYFLMRTILEIKENNQIYMPE